LETESARIPLVASISIYGGCPDVAVKLQISGRFLSFAINIIPFKFSLTANPSEARTQMSPYYGPVEDQATIQYERNFVGGPTPFFISGS
jgi:hypothetical protein